MKKDKQNKKKDLNKGNGSKHNVRKSKVNSSVKVSHYDSFSLDFSRIKTLNSKLNVDKKIILSNNQTESVKLFLKDVEIENRESLLIDKIRQCCVICDSKSSSLYSNENYDKKEILDEITYYIYKKNVILTYAIYEEVINMVAINLFRDLPPKPNFVDDYEDCVELFLIESLSHRKQVYHFFLKFLESSDFKAVTAKTFINESFITSMLNLFDSPDMNERNLVYNIFHRIYGIFQTYRPYIRTQIANVMYRYLYETDTNFGISQLLELYRCIILGFNTPLKEEYIIVLKKILIPLYKMQYFKDYSLNLTLCVVGFLEKDPSLCETVISGLLRYWTKANNTKEILLLQNVEYILERIDEVEIKKVIKPLFTQFARCVSSCDHKVVTDALIVLNNEVIKYFISENIDEVLPIIFPALHISKTHWNTRIPPLSFDCLTLLMKSDQRLFDACASGLKGELERKKQIISKRNNNWNIIYEASKLNPLYPYFQEDLSQKLKKIMINDSVSNTGIIPPKELQSEL